MKFPYTSALGMLCTILLTSFALSWVACDNNDDDDSSASNDEGDNDDESGPSKPDGCEGKNEDPIIINYYLLVNNVIIEQPATVHLDDTLVLAVEYEDTDCDLKGGNLVTNTSVEGGVPEAQHVYQITNIGCSSAKTGEPYYQELKPDEFQFDQQQYPLYFTLTDYCWNSADAKLLEFNIVP